MWRCWGLGHGFGVGIGHRQGQKGSGRAGRPKVWQECCYLLLLIMNLNCILYICHIVGVAEASSSSNNEHRHHGELHFMRWRWMLDWMMEVRGRSVRGACVVVVGGAVR